MKHPRIMATVDALGLLVASAVPSSALSMTPTNTGKGPQVNASARLTHKGTETAVDLPTAMLEDGPEATNSDDKKRNDPSYSMEATLVQNFSEMTVGDRTYVKVDNYRGQWVRLDSQVTGKNAEIRASCFGPVYNAGTCHNSQVRTVGTPSYGTWYTLTPSWSSKWVQVADTRTTSAASLTSPW